MDLPKKDDLQPRLEDLAAEINQMPHRVSVQPPVNSAEQQNSLTSLKEWLNSLHPAARIFLFLLATFLVFSLLSLVFRLVASLLSLAILAVILYAVYKFLFTPSPPAH